MLTNKYNKLYLEIFDTLNNKGQVIKNIIKTEKESAVALLNWKEDQLIMFLKKFESISPVSLSKNLTILREFANYICKEEGLEKQSFLLDNSIFISLIDTDKLLSVTLSYEQFQNIRRQLGMASIGETVNYRDKLIFELAWNGLTEDEIRMLKKSDIEYVNVKGMDIAILSLVTGKAVRIDDPEVIEDMKKCAVTTEITRIAKDGRFKTTGYKDSEYLLRPGKSGASSPNDFFGKPATALKGAFLKQDISCDGIEMLDLSLDDIRRSRLIMLLSPKNEKFFNLETVAGLYNLKTKEGLSWYKQISALKYGVK
jgi:hypothetical protein